MFLLKDKETVTLHVQEMFHWGEGFAGTYLSKCFPILCNELFYGIGQMLINIVIGRQSESAIAAMAAFRVLEGFVMPSSEDWRMPAALWLARRLVQDGI